MASFKTLSIDDRDMNALKYSGGWYNEGSWNASREGTTGTLSSSNDLDASVTFTFPEPARAVYYYGIKRSLGGKYAICLDCNNDRPDFKEIDALNPTDDGQNPPEVLWSHQFGQPGFHSLILKNAFDDRFPDGHSQIVLDRFDIEVVDNSVQPPSPPSSSSSSEEPASSTPVSNRPPSLTESSAEPSSSTSSIESSLSESSSLSLNESSSSTLSLIETSSSPRPLTDSSSSTLFSVDPSSSATAAAASSSSSSPPQIGAIVGGVVGGAVVLGLLSLFCFFLLRRRRQRDDDASTQPYIAAPSTRSPKSTATSSFGNTGLLSDRRESRLERSPPQLSSREAWTPRRETDAGRIADEEEDTLPPEYDQVFRRERESRSSAARMNSSANESSGQSEPMVSSLFSPRRGKI